MLLLILCLEFMYIGLFAVGGGMATIPFMLRLSEKYPEWFSISNLADMIAIGESTPGPIGINIATYAGYTVAGVSGAILASLALIMPAFIILIIILPMLVKYRDSRLVNSVFKGLRPAVTGLIAAAGAVMLKIVLISDGGRFDFLSFILFAFILICVHIPKIKKLHPISFIAVAAFIGIVLKL
jgi:chromate transporter